MRFDASISSMKIIDDEIYVAINDLERKCRISIVKDDSIEDLVLLNNSPCYILLGSYKDLLVSAGEILYVISNNEARPLLRAKAGNIFWHATEACDKFFVQEYGEDLTGIYVSEDLKSFRRIITYREIDPSSRHFHYITFDRYRKILITTLGDGNIVRVAFSDDCGSSRRPLYKGPWQFVPVFIERDRWIFGFDSGIARGGAAIYYPEKNIWRFIFLKAEGYAHAQFTLITKFGDYYIGGLGYPTSIIVSKDLYYWYTLHIDNSISSYNYFVYATIWRDKLIASTGRELLIFNYKDVEEALKRKPFLYPYKAYTDRVRGLIYILKRLPWMIKL
ncbi:MAG: hypothetical protein GU359_00145 [Desulfurococcales archaeon]|jgi:hypothetical protein|nr:hypothetical protein [Desulfurococcales archaeon]